jgi:hypothetical protein
MPRKATKTLPSSKPKAAPPRSTKAPRRPKAVANRPEPPTTAPASKAATVLAALGTSAGATLAELMALTGWQAHSVRGFLSGTVRTKLGLPLTSEATPDGRRYRVTGTATRAG